MNIAITNVTADGDNLYIVGTVDGVVSRGHGWVARTNHMTPAEVKAYQEELLINGKPADMATLMANVVEQPPVSKLEWLKDNWLPIAIGVGNALLTILLRHF